MRSGLAAARNEGDLHDFLAMRGGSPLYPRKRTYAVQLGMSALCQKRTFAGRVATPALCQKQNSDRTQCTYTIVGIVGAVGFSGARWISRMSPWCTVAT